MSARSWLELFRGKRAIFTVVLNLGIALHAIDVFVIATVMPLVVADIGGVAFYAWATMVYMVATIVGSACGGIVQMDLGARRGYVLGAAIFLTGTVGCALAPDMALMLASRAIQGLGGGLIISQSLSLVRRLYEDRLRTRALALISGVWGVAALVGPLVGGAFATIGWWRGAFWSTAPVIAAFALLAWHALPPEAGLNGGRIRQLPWRRLALLAAAVVAIGTAGVLTGGRAVPAGLLLLALGMLWLTLRLDARATTPLFPTGALSWFARVGAAYWLFLMTSITHTAIGVYLPLVMQVEHGLDPLAAGYFNAVFALSWTISSFATAGLPRARLAVPVLGGALVALLGLTALRLVIVGGSPIVIGIAVSAVGIGVGTCNLHLTAATMEAARKGEETLTAASIPTVRSLGIALGSALAGLIANNAGLARGVTPETVASAANWVLGLAILAPLCMLLAGGRFLQLNRRAHAVPAVPT
jgi:MFS family permease